MQRLLDLHTVESILRTSNLPPGMFQVLSVGNHFQDGDRRYTVMLYTPHHPCEELIASSGAIIGIALRKMGFLEGDVWLQRTLTVTVVPTSNTGPHPH